MGGNWGGSLNVTIFGESHGGGIGIVVDGLPAGLNIDEGYIARQMARRAPGGKHATQRAEGDAVRIMSGVYNGCATGTPICCFIGNEDARSTDYEAVKAVARPSHADYTGFIRYNGYNDPRGGGHFSGRLTAPLVCAGALCAMYLLELGVSVGGHILRVGEVLDTPLDPAGGMEQLDGVSEREMPFISEHAQHKADELLSAVRADGDSIGGIIECAAFGVPAGWGDPFFDSVESVMSSLLFSIPGVKGVEFGAGFALATMRGSEANDVFADGGSTISNNSGGINGGITNGMPVLARVAMRPTPSIAKEQTGLNLKSRMPQPLSITGRHDPCIAVRATPVVEAAMALALADCALRAEGRKP